MTQPVRPAAREERFVEYLQGLAAADDRAALAALRRGLGKQPGEAFEAYRYVVPWLPPEPRFGEEEALFLTAALFAWHPLGWAPAADERRARNLGASVRRLADRVDSGSIERRFLALLTCHR